MTGREAERRDVLKMLTDELELVEAHNLLFGSVQLREIVKNIEQGKHVRKHGALGTANDALQPGVVCASFNAG